MESLNIARFFATESLIVTSEYTKRLARSTRSGHPIEIASFIRSPTVLSS
jgi:hypothetical protein